MATIDIESADRDERLGEAVEAFLALVEAGGEPDAEEFVAGYPDLGDELREALEGLSLVRGLVGSANGRRLVSGRRLAGYRIVGELGSGGMGVVYEAVHVDLDRPVALKVLDSRSTRGGNGLLRFLNEAKTAAGLHHTHIVPVFDVGHVGGLLYYAMQRIEGSGLDAVIRSLRRDRPTAAGSGSGKRASTATVPDSAPDLSGLRTPGEVPWTGATAPEGLGAGHAGGTTATFEPPRGSSYYRWVAEVGRQAAQALAYAHRRGVIHRDIKPSNLLVDGRGSVWVADFGLARRLADPNLTHSNALLGTPRYMSPEQSRSEYVDGRTDVYSLGATLYELLTLRPPFEGKSTAELIEQIGQREPAPPRRADPRIPRDLETIVLKALGKTLNDRYAGAAELADDLQRFLNHEPVQARRIGPLGRLVRLARRHPTITAVTTAATILVVATVTVAYVRIVKERDRAVTAEQLTQAELRRRLLSEATLLRFSSVANRRERGLNLLTEAVRLGPDAPQRSRLRDEAIEFLALRDVEQRPDVKTGRNLGIAFTNDDRIAAVDADGDSYTLWPAGDSAGESVSFPTGPAIKPGPGRPAPNARPGARRIAIGRTTGAVIWPDSRGVRLFDASTGTPVQDIPMPGRELHTLHVVDSSEGPRLVTVDRPAPPDPSGPHRPPPPPEGGRDEPPPLRLMLWDLRDPSRPAAEITAPRPEGVPAIFPIFAGSPDGDTIASAWFQGTSIRLVSSLDGQTQGDIESISPLRSLAFGPFGQLAASGVGAVRMWDVGTRLPLTTITPHQASPFLRFSPDGRVLAVAGFNSADIELWDPAGNALIAVLSTPEPIFGDLAFSGSGDLLAASQADSVVVWALVDSAVRRRSSALDAAPSSVAFASDGSLAMAFRGEAPARIWHAGRCPTTTAAAGSVDPLAVYSDGGGGLLAVTMDHLLKLGSSPGVRPEVVAELPEPMVTGQAWDRSITSSWLRTIQAISPSQDGRRIALLRLHEILLWDAAQPDRFVVRDIPRMASEIAWMPPPSRPAAEKSKAQEKDEKPSRRGGGRRPPGRMPWRQAALSPDGRLLLAINWAGELHGWKLHPEKVEELAWPDQIPERNLTATTAASAERESRPRPGTHTALAISPDGKIVALGQRDGSIVLHDLRDGRIIRTIPDHSDEDGDATVSCLAFAAGDPGLLAAGSNSGAVWLVRATDSAASRTEPPMSFPTRRGGIRALDFDDSASHLAIAGEDKEVQVWDLKQLARELGRLGLSW